jgi:hypothetical protein
VIKAVALATIKIGQRGRSSRHDKDRATRPPGNIESRPTNPAILTTYEGMRYDAVSSSTATKVLAWSNAVEDFLLWSFLTTWLGQLPGVSAAEGCHAFTSPIASQKPIRSQSACRRPRPRRSVVLQKLSALGDRSPRSSTIESHDLDRRHIDLGGRVWVGRQALARP